MSLLAFLPLSLFGFVAMPVMTACVAVLLQRTGHGASLVAWVWTLAIFFVFASVLALFGEHGKYRTLGVTLHLIGGPVLTGLMIWLSAKRWPAQMKTAGTAPQDEKV